MVIFVRLNDSKNGDGDGDDGRKDASVISDKDARNEMENSNKEEIKGMLNV